MDLVKHRVVASVVGSIMPFQMQRGKKKKKKLYNIYIKKNNKPIVLLTDFLVKSMVVKISSPSGLRQPHIGGINKNKAHLTIVSIRTFTLF